MITKLNHLMILKLNVGLQVCSEKYIAIREDNMSTVKLVLMIHHMITLFICFFLGWSRADMSHPSGQTADQGS